MHLVRQLACLASEAGAIPVIPAKVYAPVAQELGRVGIETTVRLTVRTIFQREVFRAASSAEDGRWCKSNQGHHFLRWLSG